MLSVLIVCREIDESLIRTVKSVEDLKPQILIDISDGREALGVRKNRLISQAAYDWVLILDTDEEVSRELCDHIKDVVTKSQTNTHGYKIPYQNFVFGNQVHYGGEKFAKARLFQKQYGRLTPLSIHEEIMISGAVDELVGVIYHDSYRTLGQVVAKFTKYAWQMAGEKRKVHEQVTFKKLFFYGPHMIWARAIKDEGWRDGWRGIVIALCFGYMEALTYWMLLIRNVVGR